MHTIEKIGGTSMSHYAAIRDNIIFKPVNYPHYYQRVFVVSAYGGITNKLLEHKKRGNPVFTHYLPAVSTTAAG